MNEEDKLIEEQFNKLPEELRLAINAVPWKSSVKEIALANNLESEQIDTLERETMLIIYGFDDPNNYIGNITQEVQIEEEVATAIAEAISEKILNAIAQKVEEIEKEKPVEIIAPVPEIAPNNLPMIEKEETVHDVPHVEIESKPLPEPVPETKPEKAPAPPPDYRYTEGKDPYREPL